jgi:hypothetical protein
MKRYVLITIFFLFFTNQAHAGCFPREGVSVNISPDLSCIDVLTLPSCNGDIGLYIANNCKEVLIYDSGEDKTELYNQEARLKLPENMPNVAHKLTDYSVPNEDTTWSKYLYYKSNPTEKIKITVHNPPDPRKNDWFNKEIYIWSYIFIALILVVYIIFKLIINTRKINQATQIRKSIIPTIFYKLALYIFIGFVIIGSLVIYTESQKTSPGTHHIIRSNLNIIQAQAELLYLTHGNYDKVCGIQGEMQNVIIRDLINETNDINEDGKVVCGVPNSEHADEFAVSAQLTGENLFYCVDSQETQVESDRIIEQYETRCPI